jgi:hypothetical protein
MRRVMLCVFDSAESALLRTPFHILAPKGMTELPPVDNLQKIEESHVSVSRKAPDLRIDYALLSMKHFRSEEWSTSTADSVSL